MNPSPLRTLTLIAALSVSAAFAQKRPESAILIDTSPTVAQTEDVADWVEKTAPGA